MLKLSDLQNVQHTEWASQRADCPKCGCRESLFPREHVRAGWFTPERVLWFCTTCAARVPVAPATLETKDTPHAP